MESAIPINTIDNIYSHDIVVTAFSNTTCKFVLSFDIRIIEMLADDIKCKFRPLISKPAKLK